MVTNGKHHPQSLAFMGWHYGSYKNPGFLESQQCCYSASRALRIYDAPKDSGLMISKQKISGSNSHDLVIFLFFGCRWFSETPQQDQPQKTLKKTHTFVFSKDIRNCPTTNLYGGSTLWAIPKNAQLQIRPSFERRRSLKKLKTSRKHILLGA